MPNRPIAKKAEEIFAKADALMASADEWEAEMHRRAAEKAVAEEEAARHAAAVANAPKEPEPEYYSEDVELGRALVRTLGVQRSIAVIDGELNNENGYGRAGQQQGIRYAVEQATQRLTQRDKEEVLVVLEGARALTTLKFASYKDAILRTRRAIEVGAATPESCVEEEPVTTEIGGKPASDDALAALLKKFGG